MTAKLTHVRVSVTSKGASLELVVDEKVLYADAWKPTPTGARGTRKTSTISKMDTKVINTFDHALLEELDDLMSAACGVMSQLEKHVRFEKVQAREDARTAKAMRARSR